MAFIEKRRPFMVGKHGPIIGKTPGILLIDPKYPHNVGAIVRAASCYGIGQVWYTGERAANAIRMANRLPREERMRAYGDVLLISGDYPFDAYGKSCTPVAIEIRASAEPLWSFRHPENPLYVFGPEDGSIPQVVLRHCHRFVIIPSYHCLNLAAAVYTVLYDRAVKEFAANRERMLPLLDRKEGEYEEEKGIFA